MLKMLRNLCLLLAISICTYIPSPTKVVAQSLPQISLGFTMIDGRIGSTEAVEGEIALFSIQSDRVVSRALDVTVNVSQLEILLAPFGLMNHWKINLRMVF